MHKQALTIEHTTQKMRSKEQQQAKKQKQKFD
jgi:hypothetical protein